ncbi:MAG: hypothetical protein E6G32_10125 [Actinobacteria bacterium]|nr:MAG: hypothetical protein E6G32_10125 [Actinomycetota bacterium]
MRTAALRASSAAVCVAAAVLLVLLALDARAWSTRLPADDLRYRRDPSASALWKTHELSPFGLDRSVLGIRDDIAYRGARASQAANLLGVLGFAMATQDVSQRATFLNNAITAFRQAIALDPANDDALFNLEYALDQLKGSGEQQAGGSDKRGTGGRAGLKPTGHGY